MNYMTIIVCFVLPSLTRLGTEDYQGNLEVVLWFPLNRSILLHKVTEKVQYKLNKIHILHNCAHTPLSWSCHDQLLFLLCHIFMGMYVVCVNE